MREIKFRAWDEEHKEFIYINLNQLFERICMEQSNFSSITLKFLKSEDKQQFTGLKDKNGKEIYEGDIVNKGYKMKPFLVKDIRIDTLTLVRMNKFSRENEDATEFEVIGNIYENPELLEGK